MFNIFEFCICIFDFVFKLLTSILVQKGNWVLESFLSLLNIILNFFDSKPGLLQFAIQLIHVLVICFGSSRKDVPDVDCVRFRSF